MRWNLPRPSVPLLAATVVLLAAGGEPAARAEKHAPRKLSTTLKLEPMALDNAGSARMGLMYFPISLPVADERPAGIKREPVYRGTPKYVTFRLGNGPRSTFVAALDEPEEGEARIYLDANRNGDLRDDGDGAWSQKSETNGNVMYGRNFYVLRASWGTPKRETSSGPYGVALYRFAGRDTLQLYRTAARAGTLRLNGQARAVLLVENDSDALYAKPAPGKGPAGEGSPTGRPLWLLIDVNGDGKFNGSEEGPERFDARGPFALAGTNYEAVLSSDGSRLTLAPTTRAVVQPKAPARPPLLAAGVPAPDFTAEGWGGGPVRLSDFKGKVVLLDFWATWCGPCQRSMPEIEKLHQAFKERGVAVLGVCVWDDRKAYERWVPANRERYTFSFAFDPAGRDTAASIARKLFNVSGIPTTYLIDREGKVAGVFVGSGEGVAQIEGALRKLVESPAQ